MNGKSPFESPFTAGDLISLAPVDPSGEIRSRHVLVYGGCRSANPDQTARDVADRDAIRANFAGDPNTTVTAVGMEGPAGMPGGWDHPGTLEGLRLALREIGDQMNEHEQFILFVTDHGDQHPANTEVPPLSPGETLPLTLSVRPSLVGDMLHDSHNEPGSFHELGTGVTLFALNKPDGPLTLTLATTNTTYTDPLVFIYDLTGDGTIGHPGEGYYIHFPVPERALIPNTIPETDYSLPLTLSYSQPPDMTLLHLNYVSFDSGPIARREEHRIYLPLVLRN